MLSKAAEDDPGIWATATLIGDKTEFLASTFDLFLAVAAIWRVNQKVEDPSMSTLLIDICLKTNKTVTSWLNLLKPN